jgi:hypothetical protein
MLEIGHANFSFLLAEITLEIIFSNFFSSHKLCISFKMKTVALCKLLLAKLPQ